MCLRVSHGAVLGDPFMRMDGQAVFKKAVSLLERSALDVCEKAGINHEEIDLCRIRLIYASSMP